MAANNGKGTCAAYHHKDTQHFHLRLSLRRTELERGLKFRPQNRRAYPSKVAGQAQRRQIDRVLAHSISTFAVNDCILNQQTGSTCGAKLHVQVESISINSFGSPGVPTNVRLEPAHSHISEFPSLPSDNQALQPFFINPSTPLPRRSTSHPNLPSPEPSPITHHPTSHTSSNLLPSITATMYRILKGRLNIARKCIAIGSAVSSYAKVALRRLRLRFMRRESVTKGLSGRNRRTAASARARARGRRKASYT